MSAQQTLRLAVVSSVVAISVGCLGSRLGQSAVLTVSARPYSPDIPLPEGFRLADQPKVDRAGALVEDLRHRYRGRASLEAVREFYWKQMPLVRWAPIGQSRTDDGLVMRFARGGKSCTVTITRGLAGLMGRVDVDVVIAQSDTN